MRRLLAAVLVTAVAVAGCGGDDDEATTTTEATGATTTAPPAETDDTSPGDLTASCALLTADQIGEVIGTEFDEGSDVIGSCEYPSTDGTTNVSVEVIDQERYDAREAEGGVEPVTGIGAAAFSDTSTGFLYVDAGGTFFRVNVTGGDFTADEVLELNRQLATLVIEQV